jgi:nucleotide-binding universal stress UspA family protein
MSESLNTIVIGTSLSPASDGVVRAGVAFAAATGATAWLVHAYSSEVFLAELGEEAEDWKEVLEETLRDRLVRQAERTGLARLPGFIPAHLRLAKGGRAWAIVDAARHLGARLVVMGAEGADSARTAPHPVGSTVDGVIRQSPCPVLVVRSKAAFPPARVEIPVDLSPISAHALRQGKAFLARLGAQDAATEVLFVLSLYEQMSLVHFTAEQIERFALGELHQFMAVNGAADDRAQVRTGLPAADIVGGLEQQPVDLVIVGTHGSRGYDPFLLGSVALEVIHRTACNLLVVPPEALAAVPRVESVPVRRPPLAGADWKLIPIRPQPPISPLEAWCRAGRGAEAG